jgi:hypothetical protein
MPIRQSSERAEHLPEFIDDVQDQTDDNTDDDARGQGEVKRKMFLFNEDISGKLSHKGQSREEQNHQPDRDQDRPDENHDLGHLTHNNVLNPANRNQKLYCHRGHRDHRGKKKLNLLLLLNATGLSLCAL